MPARQEIDQMFQSLVANGFSYLRRSVAELESQTKISVSHFAAGLELLLKARLFHEHWALVSSNPHSTPWSALKDGTLRSIAAADLVSALAQVTGRSLSRERAVFKEVFDHRNRALHFVPSGDVESVAAEQYRSWYYLYRLLCDPWKAVFSSYSETIEDLDKLFHGHAACLKVRFDELEKANKFVKASRKNALIDCFICGHESGILSHPDEWLSQLDCPVCLAALKVARFDCGFWQDVSGGYFGGVECRCGKQHETEELAQLVDDSPAMSPKEEYERGETRLHCGECLQMLAVAPRDGKLICVGCGAQFRDCDRCSCGSCYEDWAGYDCSDTLWAGCEFCEGEAGRLLG